MQRGGVIRLCLQHAIEHCECFADPAKLHKRVAATEERLDGNDPGADTRKLQEKIVEDLEKLLNQENPNGGGGGGGGDEVDALGFSSRKSLRQRGQSRSREGVAAGAFAVNRSGGSQIRSNRASRIAVEKSRGDCRWRKFSLLAPSPTPSTSVTGAAR